MKSDKRRRLREFMVKDDKNREDNEGVSYYSQISE